MAIGKRTWRPVPVDCWDWLEDLSPLAQRLWFWLWTGPTSTPHGIVTVRAYHAAGALGTKPSTLLAALAELEKAGRATVQTASDTRINLYLVGFVTAQCSVNEAQRQAIRRAIVAVDLGLLTKQALEDWEIWDAACAEADSRRTAGKRQPNHQQEQEQDLDQDLLPTDVGSVLGSRSSATQPTATASARTPQTALGAAQCASDDHAPTQSPKRQPRGQDGAKTAKPRSLAQQPPTLDETRAIFAEHNAPASEAQRCLDYWTSAGFRRKAGPIKDWPATCRTWIGNWRDSGQSYGNRKAQAPMMAFDQADLERQMAEQEREMREAEARGESWF